MVLLLGTHGAEAAAKVAQKLLDSLRPPLKVNGHELTTAASIGLALFPHDGDDTDTLIKNADTALSRAKEQGRNHYQFYTEGMNTTAFERLMLESRLRKALEQEEFVVFYQPKVSLADGRVVGVEALLRWRHPGQTHEISTIRVRSSVSEERARGRPGAAHSKLINASLYLLSR